MVKPVLFVLGASALPLAHKLKQPLDAEIHTPNCVAGGDVTYAKATAHLGTLFSEGRSIVGLCAAGILIRAVAPHLKDKHSEPPVIALAEDGSSAVPLLGGHHGANDLARRIAELCKGQAAITTASEVRFGFALDDPAPGFVLANPQHMKPATAALLAGRGENRLISVDARFGGNRRFDSLDEERLFDRLAVTAPESGWPWLVFGHTHFPMLRPLDASGRTVRYANSGCGVLPGAFTALEWDGGREDPLRLVLHHVVDDRPTRSELRPDGDLLAAEPA